MVMNGSHLVHYKFTTQFFDKHVTETRSSIVAHLKVFGCLFSLTSLLTSLHLHRQFCEELEHVPIDIKILILMLIDLFPPLSGHIGVTVDDVYKACERFEQLGVEFVKKPLDGNLTLVYTYRPL